jgi:hypothetical protein
MTPDRRFAGLLAAVSVVSAGLSSVVLYRDLQREDCGLQLLQARAMVVEDLRSRGQPVRDLVPAAPAGRCHYGFRYAGNGARVDYAVSNDWLSGVSVVRSMRDDAR